MRTERATFPLFGYTATAVGLAKVRGRQKPMILTTNKIKLKINSGLDFLKFTLTRSITLTSPPLQDTEKRKKSKEALISTRLLHRIFHGSLVVFFTLFIFIFDHVITFTQEVANEVFAPASSSLSLACRACSSSSLSSSFSSHSPALPALPIALCR
jgi:hypothetical protein